MNRGLLMSDAERASRQANLLSAVTTHTSHHWAATLVKILLAQIGSMNTAHHTPFLAREQLSRVYKGAKKRLFLFDYDVRLLTHLPTRPSSSSSTFSESTAVLIPVL